MLLPAYRIENFDDLRMADEVVVSAWNRRGVNLQPFELLLSETEQRRATSFCSSSRRNGYVSGRYLARHALTRYWGQDKPKLRHQVEIRPEQSDSGRPSVYLDGCRQELSLSISHADHWTVVALAGTPGLCVGIDAVELNEIRKTAGLQIWFSAAERLEIEESRDAAFTTAAYWGLKEAAYKTSPTDIPFVPRDWECRWNHAELELFYQGTRYEAGISLLRIAGQLLICLVKTQCIAS